MSIVRAQIKPGFAHPLDRQILENLAKGEDPAATSRKSRHRDRAGPSGIRTAAGANRYRQPAAAQIVPLRSRSVLGDSAASM
jgi:hypothetical protein